MEICHTLLKKARNEAVCINCKKMQREKILGEEENT